MKDTDFVRRHKREVFKIMKKNRDSLIDLNSIIPTEMTTENDKISTIKYNQIVDYYNKLLNEKHDVVFEKIESENRMDHYLEFGWYLHNKIFNQIPSEYHIDSTYSLELFKHLKQNGRVINRRLQFSSSESEYAEISYSFLYKDTVVILTCTFNFKEENPYIKGLHVFHTINTLIPFSDFIPFEITKREVPKIGIIKQTKFGPQVSWREFVPENKFHEDNYNEDFPDFYKDINEKLKTNKSGLYLLYGEAGTGKSSAIRHMISNIDRPFVFIPPQMINYLSNPEFTELVTTSLKNSILIIEDAEKALMKRESADGFFNSELVSSLLNLTDGLYADIAATSIIATYNCDRNLIDPALLRKGRMKAEYKFSRLSIKKSQNLIDKLGHKLDVEESMTLADIYNYQKQYSNEEREDKTQRKVGFGK